MTLVVSLTLFLKTPLGVNCRKQKVETKGSIRAGLAVVGLKLETITVHRVTNLVSMNVCLLTVI